MRSSLGVHTYAHDRPSERNARGILPIHGVVLEHEAGGVSGC